MFDMPFKWPDGRKACAMLTFDLDAESGVLHSHPESKDHLDVLAHQAYGVRVGLRRILGLLKAHGVRATFFVPGYTAGRWPEAVTAIVNDGHEIGCHGYLHESVHEVSREAETEYLVRSLDAIEALTGSRPVGYRAPKFHMNIRTPSILAAHGFTYDSSLQDSDWPYVIECASSEEGSRRIVELPVQYALDDGTYYLHLPGLRALPTLEAPSKVFEIWSQELEASVEAGGIYVLTMHPFLSGRPSRAKALDRLLADIISTEGLWVATGAEVAGVVAEHAETVRIPRPAYLPWEGRGSIEGTG